MTNKPRPKPHDIVRMRQWRRKGFAVVDLAKFFGISRVQVSRIVNYRTYANVTDGALEAPLLLTEEERVAKVEATKRKLTRGR